MHGGGRQSGGLASRPRAAAGSKAAVAAAAAAAARCAVAVLLLFPRCSARPASRLALGLAALEVDGLSCRRWLASVCVGGLAAWSEFLVQIKGDSGPVHGAAARQTCCAHERVAADSNPADRPPRAFEIHTHVVWMPLATAAGLKRSPSLQPPARRRPDAAAQGRREHGARPAPLMHALEVAGAQLTGGQCHVQKQASVRAARLLRAAVLLAVAVATAAAAAAAVLAAVCGRRQLPQVLVPEHKALAQHRQQVAAVLAQPARAHRRCRVHKGGCAAGQQDPVGGGATRQIAQSRLAGYSSPSGRSIDPGSQAGSLQQQPAAAGTHRRHALLPRAPRAPRSPSQTQNSRRCCCPEERDG